MAASPPRALGERVSLNPFSPSYDARKAGAGARRARIEAASDELESAAAPGGSAGADADEALDALLDACGTDSAAAPPQAAWKTNDLPAVDLLASL